MYTFSLLQAWVKNVFVMLNVLWHMTCYKKLYGVLIGSVLAETDTGENLADVVSYR
jgi:uncharacterized membrane protein